MGANPSDSGIRKRLIEAGLKELLEHGTSDFSLRRVAVSAQVSCAAPYRHFKDKDELVRAVIAQIRDNWFLLCDEIAHVLPVGSREHIVELLIAGVRFFVAGDNFAPFLSAGEIAEFDMPIIKSIEEFCSSNEIEEFEENAITAALLSMMYGTITMIQSGRFEPDFAVSRLRIEAKARLA